MSLAFDRNFDSKNGGKLDWSPHSYPPPGESGHISMTTTDTTAKPVDKRTARKARTRRHIFETAMQLFAARSFDTVRIEEICEAAGIAKATFFLHFASKAALIEEFNAQLVDRLQRELAAAPDTTPGTATAAEARLRLFVRVLVEEYEANAAVMRQMAREFLNQKDLVAAAQSANREVVDVVETIITDGQASGEFAAHHDPSLAATALISTWGAFTVRWSGAGTQVDIAKLHDDLLNLILGGLRPRRA